MNHLAHLLLSEADPQARIGNLLGDFVHGAIDDQAWPPAVVRGIKLHRRIDSYTDAHPLIRYSRARLQPPYRRYAPILLDVLHDHFLARHWPHYADESLAEFARHRYREFAQHQAWMPPRLRLYTERLRTHDGLSAYADLAGVERALQALARRLRRANPLAEALPELERHYAVLEADFAAFFPQLCVQVASTISIGPPLRAIFTHPGEPLCRSN